MGAEEPTGGRGTAAQAGASAASPTLGGAGARAQLSDRESTLAEFEDYLRTVNNRDGRPYETPG